jgi:hypothetical protein
VTSYWFSALLFEQKSKVFFRRQVLAWFPFTASESLDLRNNKSYFRTMNIVSALNDRFGAPLVDRVGGRLCRRIGDEKKRRNMSPESTFYSAKQRFKIGCANWRRSPYVAYFPWRGAAKPVTQARSRKAELCGAGEP